MSNGTHELPVFAFLPRNPFAIGLLSDYIKKEEYDKMELVIDVDRGVAYLHCESYLFLSYYYAVSHVFFSGKHYSFGYTRGIFI